MCHAQMIGAALQRLADRETRCSGCGRTIAAGEKITRRTCKQRGEFHILVVCSNCDEPSTLERWLGRLRTLLQR